jgi:anti-sigma factor RsiW
VSALSPHIPFDQLADYAEGRLSPANLPALQAHLATCATCAAEAAAVARLIGSMRADEGEDAPPHVVARAARLMRQRAQPPAPGLRARLLGVLQFDSGQRPQALGVRSAMTAARQLLFSAGNYELDLRLTPSGTHWAITGQMLGADATGSVECSGQYGTSEVRLSALGEFSLPPVPPGTYSLVLHLSEVDLAFPPIEVSR